MGDIDNAKFAIVQFVSRHGSAYRYEIHGLFSDSISLIDSFLKELEASDSLRKEEASNDALRDQFFVSEKLYAKRFNY